MITISILGLDQYITGRFSKDASPMIAKISGEAEENILFYAPYSYIFHAGVEQTSWQGIIIVRLPARLKAKTEALANYLLQATEPFLVNAHVEFHYYDEAAAYQRINQEYPRYITEENIVSEEDDEEEGEPYLGNVFRENDVDLEEVEAEYAKKARKFEVCEGDECECECDDDDEHCCCHDHDDEEDDDHCCCHDHDEEDDDHECCGHHHHHDDKKDDDHECCGGKGKHKHQHHHCCHDEETE